MSSEGPELEGEASEESVDPKDVKITAEGIAYTVRESFWEILLNLLFGWWC